MQRLHVIGIKENLKLKTVHLKEDDAWLIALDSSQLDVELNIVHICLVNIKINNTYTIFSLNKALQMAAHKTATEKSFKRTQIWSRNVLLRMWTGPAEGVERLIG